MLRNSGMLVALVLAGLVVVNVIANENTLEKFKREFIQQVSAGRSDIDVSEIVDEKDDKKVFLKKALPDLYNPGDEKEKHKEIFVRIGKESGHYHLGLISLEYKDKQQAQASYHKIRSSDKKPYFSNSKILTKYHVLSENNKLVVLYSETFIDEKVRKFFQSLSD